jgi:hypothetical protein
VVEFCNVFLYLVSGFDMRRALIASCCFLINSFNFLLNSFFNVWFFVFFSHIFLHKFFYINHIQAIADQ